MVARELEAVVIGLGKWLLETGGSGYRARAVVARELEEVVIGLGQWLLESLRQWLYG